MKILLKYWLLLLIISFSPAQILLNEIMIDAEDESSGEFIEMINCGETVVRISDYFLCDPRDTDAVIPFPDSMLAPGVYGIILDPDYSGEYDDLIPDGTPRFSIEDSRFGMYGISNSTAKRFAILDGDRKIADSYTTGDPQWPEETYTMERYMPDRDIWMQSLDPEGTPGARNSVSPKDRDLEIGAVTCSCENDRMQVDILIRNCGLQQIAAFDYGYLIDTYSADNDLSDTLHYHTGTLLQRGDSCRFSHSARIRNRGSVRVRAFLSAGNDIRDTLGVEHHIPLSPDDIIITEFVCKTGDRFGTEYVEFCSKAELPVQFTDLRFADQTGSVRLDTSYILYPDSLLVIAASGSFHDDFPSVRNALCPSAWRRLNNRGDEIGLLNPDGRVICKLRYGPDWSIPDDCAMSLTHTALDYRDPRNWEVSFTGSPGTPNPSSKKLLHLSFPDENVLFTAGDTLCLRVINDGYFPLEAQQVHFETPRGSTALPLPPSEPGDTLRIFPDTSGMFVPGTQTCRVYCPDSSFFDSEFRYYSPYEETPCYFNEFLFDPLPAYGQHEFIELECGDLPCDLDRWVLRVNHKENLLSGAASQCYTVLANKEARPANIPGGKFMPLEGFPVLPNDGAVFSLYDPMGRRMDSCDLRYHPELQSGKSLEKQYGRISSSHTGIWHPSVSPQGMTPGKRNSITALPGYRNRLSVDPQIFSPGKDEMLRFNIDAENGLSYCELICCNMAGQEIMRFERSLFSQPSTRIFWDGKMRNGAYPARGIYLLLAVLHTVDGERIPLRETLILR